jgi:hypothetical protein
MTAITRRTLAAFAVACLATASSQAAEPTTTPLRAEQIADLLECAIPLAAVRDALETKGYVIDSDGDTAKGFRTKFRTSDKDSEKRLLGSFSVERMRQYVVTATASGTRFLPRHREIRYASGVLQDRTDRTREYDIPLVEASLATLRDMRREVCAAGPGQAPVVESKPSPEIEQYILDRCKSGDDQACKLLRLR